MIKRLFIKALVTSGILISFGAYPTYYAQADTYKLDATINSLQRNIKGTNEITFFNNSKENIDRVFFSLGLNNSYDTKMKITEASDSNNVILPSNIYRYKYLGREIEDKTVYQVSLPQSLKAGESITLKLKFEVNNISKINNIIFLDDSISDIYSGSWYPKALNYENGYWRKRDFISNNYEVDIIVGVDETIASSGIELSSDNIKAKGVKKITYKINNARSFALALSPYITPETEQTKDGTIIKAYYKNNKSSKWNKAIIDETKNALDFYYQKFGTYPYKQISILPGNSTSKGGYTDNNIIVLHETLDRYKNEQETRNYLKWYLAYYIGQQYFGHLTGESGEYPEWITSGASLYMASAYLKEKNISNNLYSNFINQYINAAKANFNTQITQPVDELKQLNFDWENIIERGKSAQIFKMLEYNIGRKNLQDSLKELVTKHSDGFINSDLFQLILEAKSNKKLDGFFQQWVKENKKLDYAITSIKQDKSNNKYQVKLTVKRIGKAIMPVSIALTLKSGSKVFQVWDGEKPEVELTFEYNEPVKSVQIDPAQTLPDIDRSNNKLIAPNNF